MGQAILNSDSIRSFTENLRRLYQISCEGQRAMDEQRMQFYLTLIKSGTIYSLEVPY